MFTLSFDYPGDERVDIVIDDEVVASLSHDVHGWRGMDVAIELAKTIARKVGATIESGDD